MPGQPKAFNKYMIASKGIYKIRKNKTLLNKEGFKIYILFLFFWLQ